MLSKKTIQEIKQFEEAGISVLATDADGQLVHSEEEVCSSKYCDQCSSFRLLPDPDPFDWFRDGDMKAICLKVNGVIAGSLERPSEYTNICKPLYCPKLGRELSEEEKKEATERLERAIERMERK